MDELRKDFEEGVDDYLSQCKERGVQPEKPYSGKLIVRMSSELHSRVAEAVAGSGTTINDFINKAIVNELEHEYTMRNRNMESESVDVFGKEFKIFSYICSS